MVALVYTVYSLPIVHLFLFISSGDPLTNVTAKSTQTNGGTSPDSVSSQEPLATRPITTTTTISTASTSIVSTNYKPAREESTNTQTHTHTDAPHTSSKSTESAPDIDKRQVTSQEQERVCKEKERQVDAEREKAAERKRERERCYSRGPVWQRYGLSHQKHVPSLPHPSPHGLGGSIRVVRRTMVASHPPFPHGFVREYGDSRKHPYHSFISPLHT